jgi:hypothetical protein
MFEAVKVRLLPEATALGLAVNEPICAADGPKRASRKSSLLLMASVPAMHRLQGSSQHRCLAAGKHKRFTPRAL